MVASELLAEIVSACALLAEVRPDLHKLNGLCYSADLVETSLTRLGL